MAETLKNLGKLAADSRSRTIIILTGIVLVIAVTIGYVGFKARTSSQAGPSEITGIPAGIQSIPGSKNVTPQYVKLQTKENIKEAQRALKSGKSFVPTILGQQELGDGKAQPESTDGSGVGFATLAQQEAGGQAKPLWFVNLKQAQCSRAAIEDALKKKVTLADIKAACSCERIKDAGVSVEQSKQVCSCKDLRAIGYGAKALKNAGYTARQLKNCGFSACELRDAGFSAQQLKDAGFSDDELRGAGFPSKQIDAAGKLLSLIHI